MRNMAASSGICQSLDSHVDCALAISGIAISGFFSKDEILSAVFARAHGSTLASAPGSDPGSALLYVIYAIGLAAALLTAIT